MYSYSIYIYTLAPKCPNRDNFKAKVYTIWVHGPLGYIGSFEALTIYYTEESESESLGVTFE